MIFVFDLDGTLLNKNQEITPFTQSQLEALHRQGHRLWLATGRTQYTVEPFLKQCPWFDTAILNNGAAILDVATRTKVRERFVAKTTQATLIDHHVLEDQAFALVTPQGVRGLKHEFLQYFHNFNARFPQAQIAIEIASEAELKVTDAYKLLTFFKAPSEAQKMQQTLKSRWAIETVQSMDVFLDLMPLNTSKGEALQWWLDRQGINVDSVVVFGDNENDIEMLQLTRHSYAMQNAVEKAKAAAQYVTTLTHEQDGVAHTLTKWQ
jgi:Cof subfamily protein (haloacid dehalogenase superfamily)